MPIDRSGFERCLNDVRAVVELGSRLPQWPFRASGGFVAIGQWERVLGTNFATVLDGLVGTHDDDYAVVVVTDPEPTYYCENYRFCPGFKLAADRIEDEYWSGLSYQPLGDDPAGTIAYTADRLVMTGSTRRWAVWAEREWDLVIINTVLAEGPWLRAGIPFVSPEHALKHFTLPDRHTNLPSDEEAAFLSNFSNFVEDADAPH